MCYQLLLVSERILSVGFLQIKTVTSSSKDTQDGIPPSSVPGQECSLTCSRAAAKNSTACTSPGLHLQGFLKLSKQICMKYKFWSLSEQHSSKSQDPGDCSVILKTSIKFWVSAMQTIPSPIGAHLKTTTLAAPPPSPQLRIVTDSFHPVPSASCTCK